MLLVVEIVQVGRGSGVVGFMRQWGDEGRDEGLSANGMSSFDCTLKCTKLSYFMHKQTKEKPSVILNERPL